MGPFLSILAICQQNMELRKAPNTEVQWYGGTQFEIELEKTETLFTIQKTRVFNTSKTLLLLGCAYPNFK